MQELSMDLFITEFGVKKEKKQLRRNHVEYLSDLYKFFKKKKKKISLELK